MKRKVKKTVRMPKDCREVQEAMDQASWEAVEGYRQTGEMVPTVKDGKLVVTGVKAGSTTVTLNFCSNGISTTATVNVTVTQATGITGTQTSADVREIARFTIDGKRINQPQRGINIVKYSDGTVKKVIVK